MYKYSHQTYAKIISLAIIMATIGYLLWSIFTPVPPALDYRIALIAELPQAKHKLNGQVILSDGDSFKMANTNDRVRLHGIDSPELAQNCSQNGKKWACGLQAKLALSRKINHAEISCVGDELDAYQRLIATCYLHVSGQENELSLNGYENLNQWMVKNGWAIAYRFYSERYIGSEKFAKTKRLGIWRGSFMPPYNWRRQNPR